MISHAKASSAGYATGFALLVATLALLALAPIATAAPKTRIAILGGPLSGSPYGEKGGEFLIPRGVAINRTGEGGVPAGSLYVVEVGNHRVQQLKPNGEFERAIGADVGGAGVNVCTVAASCVRGTTGSAAGQLANGGGQGIAIDQANGIVYVSDQGNRRVDVFSATGTFQGAFGWGATDGTEAFQYCTTTCHAPGTSAPETGNAPGGQFGGEIGGLAVDASGNVYVANQSSRRIDVFTPTITGGVVTAVEFTRAFGWGALDGASEFQACNAPAVCHAPAAPGTGLGQFGAGSPSDIALDSAGNLYALDSANRRIEKFNTAPAPVASPAFDAAPAVTAAFASGSLYAIAVDPSANHLYVAGSNSVSNPPGQVRVAELDSSGAAVAVHGSDVSTTFAFALAVAPANLGGNIFLPVEPSGKQRIFVLNEASVAKPVTVYSDTTATFEGTVVSNSSPVAYRFEYSTDGTTWTKAPASDVNVPATSGTVPVSQSVSGLSPSQHYLVRLTQTMPVSGMQATSPEVDFFTRGPLITGTAIDWKSITPTSAEVSAEVNPNGEATTYSFQYVTRAQFEASGFAGASTVPASPEAIGAGTEGVAVVQKLSGLSPATAYYVRVSAMNVAFTADGPELTFSTFATEPSFGSCPNDVFRDGPSAFLPDCRAYEQASPADKLGGQAVWGVTKSPSIQTSPDGNRISFVDNSGLPTSGGSGDSHPFFFASRDGETWNTDGLTAPNGEPGFLSTILGWNEGLTVSASSFEGPGAGVYLRDASGHQDLAYSGSQQGLRIVGFIDSNPLFESQRALTAGGVEGKPNLYELDGGEMNLLGRVPAFPATSCNDEAGPACVNPSGGSIPGPYNWQAKSANLAEGGAYWGYLLTRAISSAGSRVFFTEGGSGRLFVREGDTKTIQVSASQRTVSDPNGEKPAAFTTASTDGSVAFFLSCQKLTDDSTAVSTAADTTCSDTSKQGMDLYAWNAANGQLEDLTVDHEAGDSFGAQVVGVLGASADGEDVYFVANGVLAPGAAQGNCDIEHPSFATGGCSLYLSHNGSVTFVARLGSLTNTNTGDLANWAAREEAVSRVSANGTLLFASGRQLTPVDNRGSSVFYRYVPGVATLNCVSCNPIGAPSLGEATLRPTGTTSFGSPRVEIEFQTRNISANGKRIFFQTPDRLVSADANGSQGCPLVGPGGTTKSAACSDVYEWEAPGEGSCGEGGPAYYPNLGGCLYLISSGSGSLPSLFGDASSDGGSVFVFTSDPFLSRDTDGVTDVYDARAGGGLASQHPVPPVLCEGEACRGSGSSAPQSQGAGTAVFQGPGNPVVKHKKVHRKKHKKKKRHAEKHHAKRKAGGAK